MRTIILILLFLTLPGKSYSCDCVGIASLKKSIEESDIIVSGIVISKSIDTVRKFLQTELPANISPYNKSIFSHTIAKYKVIIKKLYQGEISSDTITIYSGLYSSECGYTFNIWEEYKKHIFFVKQTILPIKGFSLKMERKEIAYNDSLTKYYLEIKDLCLTIIDNSELIDRLIDSDINIFFSIQGQRMNQIMKTLTVVAAIFIPLTFLAGVYGMNFSTMPELEMEYGYLGAWILFTIIALALIFYFRKKGYFK